MAIISLSFALLSVDRNEPSLPESGFGLMLVPIQELNFTIKTKFNNAFNYFKSIGELTAENDQLTEDLLQSRAEVNRLRLVEQENSQLKSLLDMQDKYSEYDVIGANVIGKEPGNWFKTFTIDKGTDSGLDKNMVVMTGDGLIGKISECGYNYSKVITIINDSDAVSVQSLRTNDIGYITGNLEADGMCKMQYSGDTSEFVVGDEIVTSKLSQIFPPGIVVGHITQLTTDSKTMLKYAIIEPAADFKHLDTVLVIKQLFVKEFIDEENTTK
jgi:rod shape-determining protein MreC